VIPVRDSSCWAAAASTYSACSSICVLWPSQMTWVPPTHTADRPAVGAHTTAGRRHHAATSPSLSPGAPRCRPPSSEPMRASIPTAGRLPPWWRLERLVERRTARSARPRAMPAGVRDARCPTS
jgi:hypothetical protein